MALIAALAFGSVAQAAGWDDFPLPRDTSYTDVGHEMRLNGVAMKIRSFRAQTDARKFQADLASAWGSDFHPVRQGERIIVGRPAGTLFESVSFRQTGPNVIEGYLSLNEKRRPEQAHGDWVRAPEGSRLISDLESADVGKANRQMVYENELSVAFNRNHFSSLLLRRGYQLDRKYQDPHGAGIEGYLYSSRDGEASLTVIPNKNRTGVVLSLTHTLKQIK